MSTNQMIPDPPKAKTGLPGWAKGLLGLVLAAMVIVAGVLIWYTQLRGVDDELTTADRDAALAVATTAPVQTTDPETEPAATLAPTTEAPVGTPAATEAPATTPAPDANGVIGNGTWVIADDADNAVGYRVQEVIAGVDTEGVGRTDQVTGSLTIEGTTLTAASFEVDVASISSDSGSRDNQFRERIMETDTYPTATFTLTEPVDLGTEPVEGATATVTATGELTLHGVTQPVNVEIDASLQNGRIGILGSIPVLFADYNIENPSFGNITTEEEGLLEFVLVFEPAA